MSLKTNNAFHIMCVSRSFTIHAQVQLLLPPVHRRSAKPYKARNPKRRETLKTLGLQQRETLKTLKGTKP